MDQQVSYMYTVGFNLDYVCACPDFADTVSGDFDLHALFLGVVS
jgi:hypothetical protein